MASRSKIIFYVDVVSPFAYLAYHLIRHSPVFKQCEVNYVPIFLGGVMKATGNRPPISVQSKAVWINNERRRWAALYDIEMPEGTPDGFPVNTITIQRALVAITQLAPHKLTDALDVLFQKFWAERNVEGVNQPESLAKALSGAIGADVTKQVMEKIGTDKVKKALNATSQQAVDDGAFGLPWFVATNGKGETESFWGFDHLGQLCEFLGLEKPVSGGWKAML